MGVAHKLCVFLRHHTDDGLVANLSEELLNYVTSLQSKVMLTILTPTQQVLNLEWKCSHMSMCYILNLELKSIHRCKYVLNTVIFQSGMEMSLKYEF